MRQPSNNAPRHQAAPKEYRNTPDMTGDYDFDASVMHCSNRDMPAKLRQHMQKCRPVYATRGPTR